MYSTGHNGQVMLCIALVIMAMYSTGHNGQVMAFVSVEMDQGNMAKFT